MAKIVIQNEKDPCIAIVLLASLAGGLCGTCTECGWPMHRWSQKVAVESAQRHVDAHEPVLDGGDLDSLIR